MASSSSMSSENLTALLDDVHRELFLFSVMVERDERVCCWCHASLSSWRMMTAAVAWGCEILIVISCRVVKLLELALSMPRFEAFDTVNSCMVGEAL